MRPLTGGRYDPLPKPAVLVPLARRNDSLSDAFSDARVFP